MRLQGPDGSVASDHTVDLENPGRSRRPLGDAEQHGVAGEKVNLLWFERIQKDQPPPVEPVGTSGHPRIGESARVVRQRGGMHFLPVHQIGGDVDKVAGALPGDLDLERTGADARGSQNERFVGCGA